MLDQLIHGSDTTRGLIVANRPDGVPVSFYSKKKMKVEAHTVGSQLLDLLAQVRSTNKADNALLTEFDKSLLHLLGDILAKHWNDQLMEKRRLVITEYQFQGRRATTSAFKRS